METHFNLDETFKSHMRYAFVSKCGRGSALVADNHRQSQVCFLKSTLAKHTTSEEIEILLAETDRLKQLSKLENEPQNKLIVYFMDHFVENHAFFTISPYLEVFLKSETLLFRFYSHMNTI